MTTPSASSITVKPMAMLEAQIEITDDTLLSGAVRLRQPKQGYRVAIDPVLLAASIRAEPSKRVLDAGLGVGAAALCLLHRSPGALVTGVEVQPHLAELAIENARENGQTEALQVIQGDLDDAALSALTGPVDQVITNPPYQEQGRGHVSPNSSKDQAHREGEMDIAAWIKACRRFLKHKGRITIIYPADRLDDLLAALNPHFGEISILPLWPDAGGDRPARRILVTARLGVKTPMQLLPGLALHDEAGSYSPWAEDVLSGRSGIPWGSQ